MFVTLLATLLFCVRGSNADSGASEWGEKLCSKNNFCITLNKGEITAEAGLCAVIPCSFSPRADFTATDLAWMKCESSKQNCDQSDLIFHTNTSEIVQSGFKGRVSLLEPYVSLKNCGIIINDLNESDSGSYQLRIIGSTPQKKEDGFTFTPKATVSVKDLTQKPTVKVPPLTAGQQTTLTCIAPGLCSGSEPEITWMWRGAGGKHITGNITAFKTENLTSVTQRHSSTLTFNPSAEHHGTKVTCKVSFINDISTEETGILNVTWAAEWGEKSCHSNFCITLNKGEITAEAGLCAVIPCSFSSRADFTATDLTWMKCEPLKQNCDQSDRIFHTNTSEIVQSGFKGRVSLLEPDVSRGNCSIIVNDLTESGSGSYQLRIIGNTPQKNGDAFTFTQKETVSVKGLTQKPTVKVPPLTAGQQTTLTCIAPGLCSGSEPEITWMWRGAGGKHITGNITDFKTENLTSVTQRHSSTLTFNATAEHHGTKVTCKVSFINDISTEETVTLNVTYMKEPVITGNTSVVEGHALNLTCSVKSFPLSRITWTKLGCNTNLQSEPDTTMSNNSDSETLVLQNVTRNDSGRFICTAEHQDKNVSVFANITVTYFDEPKITGNTSVVEGHALNLTCSVKSFPLSRITWTKNGSNTNLHSEPDANMSNTSDSVTLVIQNVTRDDSGRFICTAEHQDRNVSVFADITVTWSPKILQNSECKIQLNVLTCVCITEGFPLPAIKWPLLKNHTEYSVMTTVSDHTVNSTMTLTVKDHSNTTVECVSVNENGEVTENLIMQTDTSDEKDKLTDALTMVSWLEVVIAFLTGVLLSTVICCFIRCCHRKKEKNFENVDKTMKMIDGGQAVEEYQTDYQETVEEEGRAGAGEKATLKLNSGPEDLHYASIDFLLLKRKIPREEAKMPEQTETEYAEVKREVKEKEEDNSRDEGEMLNVKERETKHGVSKEEKEEGMAVYSNLRDVMSEI